MLRKSHCALWMALWVSLRQASFACLTILKQVVTQRYAACLFMEATSSCSPRPIRRPFPHRVPRAACRHFWGRVRSQKLMPCFLGQAARRLIGRVWLRAVAVFELRQSPFSPRRTGGARCITTIRQALFAYRFIWRSHLGNVPLLFLAGRVATLHMKAYSGIDV